MAVEKINDEPKLSAFPEEVDANGLKIEVMKNGVWQELTAIKGEPACKLAVDGNFQWLGERQSIKDEYEKFVPWATDNDFNSLWWY